MAAVVYGLGAEPRCTSTRKGQTLIRAVEQRFQVSHEAAQVRLQKLGLVPSLPYGRTQPRLLPAGTYAAGTYSARLLARRPFSHRG